MAKPTQDDITRLNRYFAIESNNEFWSLSEKASTTQDQQRLLTVAFSSLYHWSSVGTADNIHLAELAVARALCISGSTLSLSFAQSAFEHFDGKGADWIQAFTNAVLSHGLSISDHKAQAAEHYQQAVNYQAKLSEGDRSVFDATFNTIPTP
ncbi:hypothetical protein H4F20_00720 [Vibrio sp. 16]|uniref:hypothetical protein n=1 Tax=Vibrio sp. 16 TaxID=391586 RepID=UPI002FF22D6B